MNTYLYKMICYIRECHYKNVTAELVQSSKQLLTPYIIVSVDYHFYIMKQDNDVVSSFDLSEKLH